jgi:hypothetical protein
VLFLSLLMLLLMIMGGCCLLLAAADAAAAWHDAAGASASYFEGFAEGGRVSALDKQVRMTSSGCWHPSRL